MMILSSGGSKSSILQEELSKAS